VRIATYNIWNDESLPRRLPLLIDTIRKTDADIIALQEVPSSVYDAAAPLYPHSAYAQHPGEDEGLAILSRYPIIRRKWLHGTADALHVLIDADHKQISLANVHLPWQSILAREKQIVALSNDLGAVEADHRFLLGDFNGSGESSVHRYLVGDQSLLGSECAPVWIDIAGNFAKLHGIAHPPTLDTIENPRWKGKNALYAPQTMDRIYLRDSWNAGSIDHAAVFGTEIVPQTGLCPSDHYGVLADITF